ncbi:MAG: L,D-transpeptidase [Mojavia pulchra JT2-VF2]|jgi:lipoprotein-anchoring transpeptidase ErfK/SrfK|uniref:L,D-transpeptidase n=1 Tax=Mojavia pulchra JT2-VF2 TaxID=287848 RepID=A0A951UIJ5_9NOST|nr:L,D-transpeptidase [Mojavia pulchra JT2-VF2]
MKSLKSSGIIAFLIYTFGLYYSPQISLASQQKISSNLLQRLVNQQNNNDDLISQPTRLEISLSRRQVSVYRGKNRVKSYKIAVGRQGWETPTGNFQVVEMLKNPIWIHPFTGKSIPGGDPENPLGHYWIGFWTNGKNWIGFHGTPNPESVGKAASHGCIRMYNKDIQKLFYEVSIGTPVTVVK